jgi:hypothetical protein
VAEVFGFCHIFREIICAGVETQGRVLCAYCLDKRRDEAVAIVGIRLEVSISIVTPYWDGCRGWELGTIRRPYGGVCGSAKFRFVGEKN